MNISLQKKNKQSKNKMKNIFNMRFLLFFLVLITDFTMIYSQTIWEFNAENYTYSQNIKGRAFLNNGYFASHPEYKIGAFYDGECRGIAKAQGGGCTYDTFNLTVYSNSEEGELINFILLNPDSLEIPLANKVAFKSGINIGTDLKPFIWMETELYRSTDFLTFIISESNDEGIIDTLNNTITVNLNPGFDVTNLTPYFDLAPGAVAFVNGVEQISGITENDFSNPLTYNIYGVDNEIKEWTVLVNINSDIQEIYKNKVYWFFNNDMLCINSIGEGIIYFYDLSGSVIKNYKIMSGLNSFIIEQRGILFFKFFVENEFFSGKILNY